MECRLLMVISRKKMEELWMILKEICYTGHETQLWPLMALHRPGAEAYMAIMIFHISVYIRDLHDTEHMK